MSDKTLLSFIQILNMAGCAVFSLILVLSVGASWSITVHPKDLNLSPETRVIGGQEATRGQFPFQAALRINITDRPTFGTCGGSLVAENWVITAAHCVLITGINHIEVHLGAHDIFNLDEVGRISVLVPKDNFISHENYNPMTIENDVALLELPEKVQLTDRIQLLSLPRYSDAPVNLEDEEVIASGWGRYSDDQPNISQLLRFMRVHVENQRICSHFYWEVEPSNICTYTGLGKGVCNGDSGGPLTYTDKNGRTILVGLSSFVSDIGCVVSGWPSVYVRVTSFLDWIATKSGLTIMN